MTTNRVLESEQMNLYTPFLDKLEKDIFELREKEMKLHSQFNQVKEAMPDRLVEIETEQAMLEELN